MKIDPISLLVTVSPDLWLTELELALNEEGLTLGYVPVMIKKEKTKRLSVKRILEERIPNRYALYYGEIDDLCVALKVHWNGKDIVTKKTPRSATGPDFKKIFIGSRGRYGKIFEVTFRVSPYVLKRRKLRGSWKTASDRELFERRLWASGVRPFSCRREGGQGLVMELGGGGDFIRAQKGCLTRLVHETGGKAL